MSAEIQAQVEASVAPFREAYDRLAEDNKRLQIRIDELEQYGRKNCVRIFGVSEDKSDTDQVVVDLGEKLNVNIQKTDIAVSHRVGPTKPNKARPIISRITNYALRHELLKASKELRKIKDYEEVSINQDLTKFRAKLAYEARQVVRSGNAISTFVFDGKIFLCDKDKKHQIRCIDDLFPFGYTPAKDNPAPVSESPLISWIFHKRAQPRELTVYVWYCQLRL